VDVQDFANRASTIAADDEDGKCKTKEVEVGVDDVESWTEAEAEAEAEVESASGRCGEQKQERGQMHQREADLTGSGSAQRLSTVSSAQVLR
jgi:hypothetical protein